MAELLTIPKDAIKPTEPNYFNIRSFDKVINDGIKKRERKQIAGVFLYEDTNTMLFSRTNVGKSLLSFQIAFHAATGTSISDAHPAMVNKCTPKRVLIVDMELEDRDISERHQVAIDGPLRNLLIENLAYVHENENAKPLYQFALLEKIEEAAIQHNAELVIIDNITKIAPDLLKSNEVSQVIEVLKRTRQKTNCSFLVIAHTTKGDPRTAINPTSYYGSAMIQNFFSEISFLDATKTPQQFMWVHAKTKKQLCYDQTVPVFLRGAHPQCGIGFNFIQFDERQDIMLPDTLSGTKKRKKQLTDNEMVLMLKFLKESGYSDKQIACLCDTSRQNIHKILKEDDKTDVPF
jgi:RecA-family ATPase